MAHDCAILLVHQIFLAEELHQLDSILNCQRCIKDQACYSLIGVVEHSGSMGGGHYVAYVRGDRSGSKATTSGGGGGCGAGKAWFYTSDAYVKEVSMAEVLQSEAYILFYEKV